MSLDELADETPPDAVAMIVETDRGFEARCLECDRVLAIGDFDAMREWVKAHRRRVHGDPIVAVLELDDEKGITLADVLDATIEAFITALVQERESIIEEWAERMLVDESGHGILIEYSFPHDGPRMKIGLDASVPFGSIREVWA